MNESFILFIFHDFVRKKCKWSLVLNELAYYFISNALVYDDAKMVFKMTKLHSEKMSVDQG